MAGIGDLIPDVSGPSFRTARVITVTGKALTVDLNGSISVMAADSCNPRPNDTVLLIVDGQTMRAIATLTGPYRQAVITVTASTSTTVTGIINGTSTTIAKSGTFTVTNGQVCPLFWSADGSRVWCLANEQQATTAPPTGSSAGTAPGGVKTGVSTYAATWAGFYAPVLGRWTSGAPKASGAPGNLVGAIFYGTSRFRELQGRTIRYIRAYLPGDGSPTVWGVPHAGPPVGAPTLSSNAGARPMGGWVALPTSLATFLISGTGTGGLAFTGVANLQGIPAGAIEIGWSIG